MRIAYYISDYGYGHASRSIAIIRELIKQNPHYEIFVCHSFAVQFLQNSLNGLPVNFRLIQTDLGYVTKQGAIDIAPSLFEEKYNDWILQKDGWVDKEVSFLNKEKIDFVLSDIVPFAFDAADNCGIPSIAISNFTWYTAYKHLISAGKLHPLKQSYDKIDHFFHLACSTEKNWGKKNNLHFGFFSRLSNKDEVKKIRRDVDPYGKSTVIFLGLGMKINNVNLESLKLWDSRGCKFIVSSNITLEHPNVFHIPKDYNETQNFIAASDYVITKAGWGTVSEAVCNNVPFLLLERDLLNEDFNTIQYIKNNGFGSSVSLQDLQHLTSVDEFIEGSNKRNSNIVFLNEVKKIANDLAIILKGK